MKINAQQMDFKELNEKIRASEAEKIEIDHCNGQRYIGAGLSGKKIMINGTPGNALGAYLDGADIAVFGNAQDATGDTMNQGTISIDGSSGDATGYAMRGGHIFVKGNSGYRAGIHMKAYKEKLPVIVIGGKCGSFLGEYQAGGIIIVLGIGAEKESPIGNFCATGMHGGKIYIRTKTEPKKLPAQVNVQKAEKEELQEISAYISEFCTKFGYDKSSLMQDEYYIISPNSKNPYKQLYVYN